MSNIPINALSPEFFRATFDRLVQGLIENVEKRQYWNAIIILLELQKLLTMAFDDVLKGRS